MAGLQISVRLRPRLSWGLSVYFLFRTVHDARDSSINTLEPIDSTFKARTIFGDFHGFIRLDEQQNIRIDGLRYAFQQTRLQGSGRLLVAKLHSAQRSRASGAFGSF